MKCELCAERPAAFQIQHPETSLHWRCLHCTRDMAMSDSKPFVVFGARTKNRSNEMADRITAGRLVWALLAALRSDGR